MSAPADRGPAGTAGAHVRSLCVNARHSGLDDSSAWSATVTEQARVFVCTRPGARRVYVLTVNLAEAREAVRLLARVVARIEQRRDKRRRAKRHGRLQRREAVRIPAPRTRHTEL